MSTPKKLTRARRQLLALAVAAGRTNQEAAAAVGVNEKTVRRALEDPDFCELVGAIQQRVWDGVAGRITDGMAEAAQTLRALLAEDNPASVRLSAARAFLDYGPKLRDSVETDRRLAELERKWTEHHGDA